MSAVDQYRDGNQQQPAAAVEGWVHDGLRRSMWESSRLVVGSRWPRGIAYAVGHGRQVITAAFFRKSFFVCGHVVCGHGFYSVFNANFLGGSGEIFLRGVAQRLFPQGFLTAMTDDREHLIARAKAGDDSCLGQLLASHRRYLTVLARLQISRRLQGKLDASDIVQEVFLDAHRGVGRFQGANEPQFVQWLKSILAAKLANNLRHYLGTQQRDASLEQQMQVAVDQSSVSLAQMLVDPRSSPSQHVCRDEQGRLVAEALSRLPETYQQVLWLRHLDGLTFPQIAEQLQRSVDSVEKLWLRGLTRLRREFRTLSE